MKTLETRIFKIDDIEKEYDSIKEAARLIRKGEVVAFPTETVYGLGANALKAEAVRKIFEAKGRPGDNPLIVHVARKQDITDLVEGVPQKAIQLMDVFWPGPLTLILRKSPAVPYETTAGLNTVAIRMPNHPVALALIRESGVPIAAPSANRSGRPSPTTALHVIDDLGGRIPVILDGGASNVGLESTVLDMTGDVPVILRPGGVTKEMLVKVLGRVEIGKGVLEPLGKGEVAKSPGMKYTHYAPKASVIIVRGHCDKMVSKIIDMAGEYSKHGQKVGILATQETMGCYNIGQVLCLGSREKPSTLAANLFASLRKFDRLGVDIILAEGIEERDEGLAVMNRMARAAGFHIIDV